MAAYDDFSRGLFITFGAMPTPSSRIGVPLRQVRALDPSPAQVRRWSVRAQLALATESRAGTLGHREQPARPRAARSVRQLRSSQALARSVFGAVAAMSKEDVLPGLTADDGRRTVRNRGLAWLVNGLAAKYGIVPIAFQSIGNEDSRSARLMRAQPPRR